MKQLLPNKTSFRHEGAIAFNDGLMVPYVRQTKDGNNSEKQSAEAKKRGDISLFAEVVVI